MSQTTLANVQKWYGYPIIGRDIHIQRADYKDDSTTIEVDMVIISWAKNDTLKKVTEDSIKSCIILDPDIKFNFYVVETNKDINYDYIINTKTIYPESKFGYHRYLNIGREAGNSKYVCLCNNDLTYQERWATNIINFMEMNPDIRSASPWCPETHEENTSHTGTAYIGWHVRGEVLGHCIFQQRDIYETIGDLDEQFEFWFCDNDYALTLSHKNILHALLPDSVVNHHNNCAGETARLHDSVEYNRLTDGQYDGYDKKWTDIIPTLSHITLPGVGANNPERAYHLNQRK